MACTDLRAFGVDPGLRGGLAVVEREAGAARPRIVWAEPMPLEAERRVCAQRLYRLLRETAPALVVLEAVSAAPGQGNASGFTFGHAAGVVEGVAGCGAWRLLRIPPSAWKAAYRLPGGKAAKVQAIELAARIFGEQLPEGQAEAALLAWYGLQRG